MRSTETIVNARVRRNALLQIRGLLEAKRRGPVVGAIRSNENGFAGGAAIFVEVGGGLTEVADGVDLSAHGACGVSGGVAAGVGVADGDGAAGAVRRVVRRVRFGVGARMWGSARGLRDVVGDKGPVATLGAGFLWLGVCVCGCVRCGFAPAPSGAEVETELDGIQAGSSRVWYWCFVLSGL